MSRGTPKRLLNFVGYQQASGDSGIERVQELEAPAYKLYAQSKKYRDGAKDHITNVEKSGNFIPQIIPSAEPAIIKCHSNILLNRVENITSRGERVTTESNLLSRNVVEASLRLSPIISKLNLVNEYNNTIEIEEDQIASKEKASISYVVAPEVLHSEREEVEKVTDFTMLQKGQSYPKTPPRGSKIGRIEARTPSSLHGYLSQRVASQVMEKRKRKSEIEDIVREMKKKKDESEAMVQEKSARLNRLDTEVAIWEKLAADMEAQAMEARKKAEEERERRNEMLAKLEKTFDEKISDAASKSRGLEEMTSKLLKETRELEEMEKKQATSVQEMEHKITEQVNDMVANFQPGAMAADGE